MRKEKMKRYIIISFIAVSLLITWQFMPRRITTILEKNNLIINNSSLTVYEVDLLAKSDNKIVYKSEITNNEKITNLYEYLSQIKVRRTFKIFEFDYIKANPRYYFLGAMTFDIRGNKYLTFLNKNGSQIMYINTDGFDMEKIKKILE